MSLETRSVTTSELIMGAGTLTLICIGRLSDGLIGDRGHQLHKESVRPRCGSLASMYFHVCDIGIGFDVFAARVRVTVA